MFTNTTGNYNTAMGQSALYNNYATNNTANGASALYANTSGTQNTASGVDALAANTTGNYNSGFGDQALKRNTTGSYNSSLGELSGQTITTGSQNTCLGYGADVGAAASSNRGAFGYNAVNNQGNNTIWLGDANHTGTFSVGGQYTQSDGRFKFNVKEEVKGLEFINKLRPVTYQMNTEQLDDFKIQNMSDSIKARHKDGVDYTESSTMVHSGFIAQEINQAATACGFASSIVSVPADPNISNYGVNYAEIVVPLVKAVQELSKTVDSLKTVQSGQRTMNNDGQGRNETISQLELANKGNVILYQNEPNPFDGATVIRYFIPDNISGSAFVVFYDMYGKEVNKLEIKEKGFGKIEANTENLAAGIYSYSLLVDGKSIDTRKMIRNK